MFGNAENSYTKTQWKKRTITTKVNKTDVYKMI